MDFPVTENCSRAVQIWDDIRRAVKVNRCSPVVTPTFQALQEAGFQLLRSQSSQKQQFLLLEGKTSTV